MFKKFEIEKNDIITITGSGGKTSLMFFLAYELSKKGRVLVTTTTKIYVPDKSQFEKMYIDENIIEGENKNIFVVGKNIKDNKIIGLEYEEIKKIKDKFDYILIEGDGAKEKLLKEWNDFEPCIPNFSNKVIGVLNLDILNMKLKEENIHRFNLFEKKYPEYIGKKVNIDFLKEYLKKGKFFDNTKNEKYIFLNGADGEKRQEKEKIAKYLKKFFEKEDFKIVYGSLKNCNNKKI